MATVAIFWMILTSPKAALISVWVSGSMVHSDKQGRDMSEAGVVPGH